MSGQVRKRTHKSSVNPFGLINKKPESDIEVLKDQRSKGAAAVTSYLSESSYQKGSRSCLHPALSLSVSTSCSHFLSPLCTDLRTSMVIVTGGYLHPLISRQAAFVTAHLSHSEVGEHPPGFAGAPSAAHRGRRALPVCT